MFESLPVLPADPILGLMAAFRKDPNPQKVDLGVGVYRDENGETPIMESVVLAQENHAAAETTKAYVGPPGDLEFNERMQELLFGAGHAILRSGRVTSAQTPGGCGALRVAAELINRAQEAAQVWVSEPTWANHIPLISDAGLQIKTYPYFDRATNDVRFDDMLACLATAGRGDLVLLHGCCHNPSGVDLDRAQWQAIAELSVERGFTPFVDIAYQGLSTGIDDDAYGLRTLVERVPELVVASSCSKNFGLYRERVGCLALVSAHADDTKRAATQMQNVIRGIYSMPPNHGAAIVRTILASADLTATWRAELDTMRQRINDTRDAFATKLSARLGNDRFDFVRRQRGLFSFLGIEATQIDSLRENFSIYMVDSSRINIAGLNTRNIDYVCDALVATLTSNL